MPISCLVRVGLLRYVDRAGPLQPTMAVHADEDPCHERRRRPTRRGSALDRATV